MGVRVWWDQRCLEAGQKWEEGFCNGLINSTVFLPIISKCGLFSDTREWQNFSLLCSDSHCDNLFLEYRLALELKEMGLINSVCPVFVGEPKSFYSFRGLEGSALHRNFTKFDLLNRILPKIKVCTVEGKVKEHLERQGLGAPVCEEGTVQDVWEKIKAYQGGFLEGRGEDSLISIAIIVKQTVDYINTIRCDSISEKIDRNIDDTLNQVTQLNNYIAENILQIKKLQSWHILKNIVICCLAVICFVLLSCSFEMHCNMLK
mmetsp:Transcript_17229/g.17301  ORF Transcript_17229/g.17301 Transcript_17229/m.17301 type:complete len:261 (+) Transcript_17229:721-1503(+)